MHVFGVRKILVWALIVVLLGTLLTYLIARVVICSDKDNSAVRCAKDFYYIPDAELEHSVFFHKKGETIILGWSVCLGNTKYTSPKDGYYCILNSSDRITSKCKAGLCGWTTTSFKCDPHSALHGRWKYIGEVTTPVSSVSNQSCQYKNCVGSWSVFKEEGEEKK